MLRRSLRIPSESLTVISSVGVCTASVRCLLLWKMCSQLLGRCWGIAHITDYHRSTATVRVIWLRHKEYLLNDVTKQTETQAHILHKSSIIVKRFPVYFLTSQMRKPHCGRSSNVNDLVDLRNRLLLQKPI